MGKLRLRSFGGHGGHNGLRNIHSLLKSNQYKRVRIGIDQDTSMPLDRYVLDTFSKDESIQIDLAVDTCVKIVDDFILQIPFSDIMTTYNTQT